MPSPQIPRSLRELPPFIKGGEQGTEPERCPEPPAGAIHPPLCKGGLGGIFRTRRKPQQQAMNAFLSQNAPTRQKAAFELFQNWPKVHNSLLNRNFMSLNFDEFPIGGPGGT